jgi:hypothetical protein
VRTFRWSARCGCELACRGEPGSLRALHGERLAAASTAPGVVTHHGGRRRLSRLGSTARAPRRVSGWRYEATQGCVPLLAPRRCRYVRRRTAPSAVSSRILPSLSCRRVELAACVRVGPFAVACPWEAELRASNATRVFPRVARGPLCQRRVALSSLASRALLGAWGGVRAARAVPHQCSCRGARTQRRLVLSRAKVGRSSWPRLVPWPAVAGSWLGRGKGFCVRRGRVRAPRKGVTDGKGVRRYEFPRRELLRRRRNVPRSPAAAEDVRAHRRPGPVPRPHVRSVRGTWPPSP